jgi:hypothetical protein
MLLNEVPNDEWEEFPANEEHSSRLKKLLSLSLLLITLTLIGRTYAANIQLTNTGSQEFGQGIQVASACDSQISSTPLTTFKNDSVTPGNIFTGVRLSGVSQDCKNKLFVLKAYSDTGTALPIGGDTPPFGVLKFHFDNSSWIADGGWCLAFQNGVTNSASDNGVTLNTNTCLSSPYWKNYLSFASSINKYTLETRENTVRAVTLNYTKGDGRTMGWVYDTGEFGATNGYAPNQTNFTFRPDTINTKYVSIYVEITQAEFNSPSTTSALFNVSAANGSTCTNKGVVSIGTNSQAPGVTSGFYWTAIRGVEFVCSINSNDILTIS